MKKILVVEDDAKIRAALTIRLKAAGYQVQTALDGFQGLKSAVQDKSDLILSDIWMPVGLGLSLAQRLDELGLAGIPVIFITAGKEQHLRQAAKDVGAAAFFQKPYDAAVLPRTIAETLARDKAPTHADQPATSVKTGGMKSK
jgi:DNA-binding response OmpR family regulator